MPSARFVSARKPSTSRYNSPNTEATIRSKRSRSHQTFRPSALADRTIPNRCPRRDAVSAFLRTGEVKRVPGHLYGRGIHHLSVHADRAGARGTRPLVRLDHFSRPGHLVLRRGEDLVDDGDLRGVDAPFAVEAEGPREAARRPQAILVAVVGHGAVHGPQPRRPGRPPPQPRGARAARGAARRGARA